MLTAGRGSGGAGVWDVGCRPSLGSDGKAWRASGESPRALNKESFFFNFVFFFEYLFIFERQRVSGGGTEREGDTESEAGSRL